MSEQMTKLEDITDGYITVIVELLGEYSSRGYLIDLVEEAIDKYYLTESLIRQWGERRAMETEAQNFIDRHWEALSLNS